MRCPSCGSESVVKKGWNRRDYIEKQVHLCKECGRRFVENPGNRHPGKLIMEALNLYSTGDTMGEVKMALRSRYRTRISKSTIHRWVERYSHLAPMLDHRGSFGPDSLSYQTMELDGERFRFSVNHYKLSLLDPPAPVVLFLDDILSMDIEGPFSSLHETEVRVEEEVCDLENDLCRIASLNRGSSKLIRESHWILERFALINDGATLCCDLPLIYGPVSGGRYPLRADMVRYEKGRICLVDYIRSSLAGSTLARLALSAEAFAEETGLPLSSLRCGYFDEGSYREFDPTDVIN